MILIEKIVLCAMIALLVAAIASTSALAVLGHLQKPEPVPDVPFPPILRSGVVPTPAQVLVDTVRVVVHRQDEGDVLDAIITDIDAHGGTVVEWSYWDNTVYAIVPASYPGRIALLRKPDSQWLHPNYREWIAAPSGEKSRAHATGPLTELRIEVAGRYFMSSSMAYAMRFSAMSLTGSVCGLVAVVFAVADSVEQRRRRRPVTMETIS